MNKIERFNIGAFQCSRVNLKSAADFLEDCLANGKNGYVCVSNSFVAYTCNQDGDFSKIISSSLLTVPDGRPLIWMAHRRGCTEVGQCAGNAVFHEMLKRSMNKGYSHFFYGSTPETIEKMKIKMEESYPTIKLLGAVSPPFKPIEEYDIKRLADEINKQNPDFFWVGLGAPKQERLMALLQPLLNKTICLGVGLVFDYFAGNVTRAPKWMQKSGLEWLYRTIQQPNCWKKVPFRPVASWIIENLIKTK